MDTEFIDRLAEGENAVRDAARSFDEDTFNQVEATFDAVRSEARQAGVTRINEGGERVVYHGGSVAGTETVIKIAINGCRQNEQAVETWNEMGETARECVAPVIAWSPDRQWIVQRKASAGRPGTVDSVVDRLAQAGWRMSDPNLENVGYLDGRPVITDLGLLYRL